MIKGEEILPDHAEALMKYIKLCLQTKLLIFQN